MDICSNYPTTPSFHNRREKMLDTLISQKSQLMALFNRVS